MATLNKAVNCYSQKVIPLAFDESMSYLEDIACLKAKINEVITFVNNVLEDKITEYIDERFNDMMINAMYESETETLVLYLSDNS